MEGSATSNHNMEDNPSSVSGPEQTTSSPATTPGAAEKGKSRWRPFSALKDKANIQDRLLEGLLSQILSPEDGFSATDPTAPGHIQTTDIPNNATRPGFNITTMSTNFRRFNARIGVVFQFQARLLVLLSWQNPAQTISLLAVYTLVCLDPYLLSVLPLAILLLGILIPSFMARHPSGGDDVPEMSYSALGGPPRAPARTVKPVKELSRDFFRNMRDLQNSMEDFSSGHDKVVSTVVPVTNFSDETLSSALFLGTLVVATFMSIAAHLLPWRLIFLVLGWSAVLSNHPAIVRMLQNSKKELGLDTRGEKAQNRFNTWMRNDILLDSAPETREVEVFELQRRTAPEPQGEWEAWLFSPTPYDPLSQSRIAGDRAKGTRFFEDVKEPEGWVWSEKKWALDLWSREWVEERIITGVEVETEGERWVYDMFDERNVAKHDDNVEDSLQPVPRWYQDGSEGSPMSSHRAQSRLLPSWEEGDDGESRRGEWRRRRWVRLVKRKMNTINDDS